MASGSFETKSSGGLILRVYYNSTVNVATHSSSVDVKVYVVHYRISVGARSGSTITCAGQTYTYTAPSMSFTISGQSPSESLIGQHSFTVAHDSSGNKAATISASWAFNGTYGGVYTGTMTASKTVTLDHIDSQSSISSMVVDNNNTITVDIDKKLPDCTHTVTIEFATNKQVFNNVDTQLVFNMPMTWWNAVPNASTYTGKVTVQTIEMATASQVGSAVYAPFTATIPESCVPSILGIYWTKSSDEPSDWPITQDVSKGYLWVSAVGSSGSTISSCSLTFAGLSSTSLSLTIPNINTHGNLDAVAKVTDSRGRTATKTVTFTVAPYHKPSIDASVYRSDADGNETATGDYMTVMADVSISNVGSNGYGILKLSYKQASSYTYTEVELDLARPITIDASSNYTWDWVITAADSVNTVTLVGSIPTGKVILDILADGSGISFGQAAENSGLYSTWDFTGKHINGNYVGADIIEGAVMNATDMSAECVYTPQLVIGEDDVSDHVVDHGVSGIWTYRKWRSGLIEMWGNTTVSLNKAAGTSYAITGDIAYPFTLKSLPHIQVSNGGGYLVAFKLNSVTAAYCNLLYWAHSDVGLTNVLQDLYIHVVGKWK